MSLLNGGKSKKTYPRVKNRKILKLMDNIEVYRDLIDSYIFCTKLERKMQADIRKNGLTYKAISATGKEYMKDNPSVKNAVMYNKQRLAILSQMGLSIDKVESESDDEL